jgi:hypothetical protein
MGFPITEPYWTRAITAGREQWVLVQLYERRALTYTPTNPAEFQVEMGNVGQHYFRWRYRGGAPVPGPGTPTPAPQPAGGPERVITIDSPADGAGVTSGLRVSGRVTVVPFERNLSYQVYDAEGRRIGSGPITVSGDFGGPGVFSGTVQFPTGVRGAGRIEITDLSAENGFVLARAVINVNLGSGDALNPPPASTPQRVITIDSPPDGAPFVTGDRLTGRVTVAPFENNLTYRVYDFGGSLLGVGPVSVNAGAPGAPATYEAQISFQGNADAGRVEVLDISPADGSVLASALLNVRLRAGGQVPPSSPPKVVITIDSPGVGTAVASGVRLQGRVTVSPFENNLSYRVYDMNGALVGVGPMPVTPTGDFGSPGTFEGPVTFTPNGLPGRVQILAASAADGSIVAEASVVVRLGGGGPTQLAPPTPRRVITIDSPAGGATVTSGGRVTGRVTVSPFENNLSYRVYDMAGNVIGQGPLTVRPLNGQLGAPGVYDGPVNFQAGSRQGVGRFEVLELSAADGSVLAVRGLNVVLR